MQARVVFEMSLPFAVKREAKWFISWCPPLSVYSQGPTQKKAVENLVDALRLFLVSCYERGTLDRVLKDSGFRPLASMRPGAKKVTPRRGLEMLKVPLPFVIEKRHWCPA